MSGPCIIVKACFVFILRDLWPADSQEVVVVDFSFLRHSRLTEKPEAHTGVSAFLEVRKDGPFCQMSGWGGSL